MARAGRFRNDARRNHFCWCFILLYLNFLFNLVYLIRIRFTFFYAFCNGDLCSGGVIIFIMIIKSVTCLTPISVFLDRRSRFFRFCSFHDFAFFNCFTIL